MTLGQTKMKMNDAQGRSAVPATWIHSKVTLDEIEGPNRAKDLICPKDNPEWRAFKGAMREGDELWYFTAPPDSFFHAAGRTGYVIIRSGEQLDNYVVLMN